MDQKKPASKKKTPATKKKAKKTAEAAPNDKKTPIADSQKPPTAAKSAPKKKTMLEMVHDAIVAMGDRTGSSSVAIAKYVVSECCMEDTKTFRSRLNLCLKSAVKNKRFKKIRNSYKIDPAFLKMERDRKKKANTKKSEATLKKEEQEKRLKEKKELEETEKNMTPEELQAHKEKQEKEKAAREKKEEAERLKKERAERIKRRRFPMEDAKLHLEDKELGVKPPEDVTRRPALPTFFSNKAASKSEHLEYGSWGTVTDLLAVYHFFRGDVHFTLGEETPLVPEFTLKHLKYAVDEVLNGNAKRSRMVPPLISHLFVVSLQLLLTSTSVDGTAHERRLSKDLSKLAAGLSPASWGEVCALYMDAMERFYVTNASVDPNVLPSGVIDIHYLMRSTNVAEPMTPAKTQTELAVLPDGYCAYLGNPHSALARGQTKLLNQDAWNLSAEELMALLRALTDDVLAMKPEIREDIARRDGEMYELLKAKRSADTQFRKIRLAFEGPKQPSKKKPTEEKKESTEEKEEAKQSKAPNIITDENKENATEDTETEPMFKPTATQKQFVSVTRRVSWSIP
jgi:histone H1/5